MIKWTWSSKSLFFHSSNSLFSPQCCFTDSQILSEWDESINPGWEKRWLVTSTDAMNSQHSTRSFSCCYQFAGSLWLTTTEGYVCRFDLSLAVTHSTCGTPYHNVPGTGWFGSTTQYSGHMFTFHWLLCHSLMWCDNINVTIRLNETYSMFYMGCCFKFLVHYWPTGHFKESPFTTTRNVLQLPHGTNLKLPSPCRCIGAVGEVWLSNCGL